MTGSFSETSADRFIPIFMRENREAVPIPLAGVGRQMVLHPEKSKTTEFAVFRSSSQTYQSVVGMEKGRRGRALRVTCLPLAITFALASWQGEVAAASTPDSVAGTPVTKDWRRSYHIERREMKVIVRSALNATLTIQDTIHLDSGTGLAQLTYRLPRLGKLSVSLEAQGSGQLSTTTDDGIARALDAFVRWHEGEDVSAVVKTLQFPGSVIGNPPARGIAVVVREDRDCYVVDLIGEAPVVAVHFDLGLVGKARVQRTAPGLENAQLEAFVRFDIPRLDAEGAKSVRLETQVGPKQETLGTIRDKHGMPSTTVRILDDRRYWKTSVVRTDSGGYAVEVYPSENEGHLEASGEVIFVPNASFAGSQNLHLARLEWLLPSPKLDDRRYVDLSVAVDLPTNREAWVKKTLNELGDTYGNSHVSVSVAARVPPKVGSYSGNLRPKENRGEVASLLRISKKARGPLVVLTDRPSEYAKAIERLGPSGPIHIIAVGPDEPTHWKRVSRQDTPDVSYVESHGGIWIELGKFGRPVELLWEHLVFPRFLDDLVVTVNDRAIGSNDFEAVSVETSDGGVHQWLPASLPLGSGVIATFVKQTPAIGRNWLITGRIWTQPVKWTAKASNHTGRLDDFIRIPIPKTVPPEMQSAIKNSYSAPKAWVSRVPWKRRAPTANPCQLEDGCKGNVQ